MKFAIEHLRAIADMAERAERAVRRDGVSAGERRPRPVTYVVHISTDTDLDRLEVTTDGRETTVRFLEDE